MSMPKVFQLVALLTLVGLYAVESQSISERRVNYIRRLIKKIDRRLNGIEHRNYACNDTVYEVQAKMDVLAEQIGHLYKGTLLAELDLSRGYAKSGKILCKLPNPIESCLKAYEGTPLEVKNAQSACVQQIMWKYRLPDKQRQISRDEALVTSVSYTEKIASYEVKKLERTSSVRHGRSLLMVTPPATASSFSSSTHGPTTTVLPLRLRKEYRALTLTERTRFHNALQALYKDGTMAAFARTHRRANRGAHRGAAFLPWHRVFITLFEDQLQRIDPTVALPYWDSSLDDKMDFPTDSILWSADYLGNGGGAVITGPFKNFTSNTGSIERAYGDRARLISKRSIDRVMSRCNYRAINTPRGTRGLKVESFHNSVHTWVGGEMRVVGTAPFDPVFYLHHAFIDYIWEKFRERQKTVCGVDPEIDYVMDAEGSHNITSRMSRLRGYWVRDGLLDFWTDEIFRYEDSPSCDNNCGGSPVLECDVILNYCIPMSRFEMPLFTTSTFAPSTTWPARKRRAVNAERNETSEVGNDTGVLERPSKHCDKYLDPDCLMETITTLTAGKQPIPSSIDVGAIDKMVPRYRGEEFQVDPEEGDDKRTIRLAAMRRPLKTLKYLQRNS